MDKDLWIPELVSLARRGFAVAVQSTGSQRSPWPAQLEDVKSRYPYLAPMPTLGLDPAAIAVGGESAGAIWRHRRATGKTAGLTSGTGWTRQPGAGVVDFYRSDGFCANGGLANDLTTTARLAGIPAASAVPSRSIRPGSDINPISWLTRRHHLT
jgi:hypothetical protein